MQGIAFLGPAAGKPRQYVHGARDRVDEVFDLVRSVRDDRWLYIRNFMPHLSWMQPERFSDGSTFRQELKNLAAAGQLGPDQLTYAAPRRALEELYDTHSDPHQLNNLADRPKHQERLAQLRAELRRWLIESRDAGFLTEPQVWERIGQDRTPQELARVPARYPLESLIHTADLVGREDAWQEQIELLSHADDGVRYWAAVGLHAAARAGGLGPTARSTIEKRLDDTSPVVRIELASALAALGQSKEGLAALAQALDHSAPEVVLHAARAAELLEENARPLLPPMRQTLERARASEHLGDMPMFIRFSLEAALDAPWAKNADRIQPYKQNSYYWQYKGKPVLLLGGSDQDNLFNHPQLGGAPLAAQLDRLVAAGGNYVRNTMSDRDKDNVYAFARAGDLYDLNRWNEEYWHRLESFLRLAADRDVIVQIELWDMWDLTRTNWDRHPFNPLNNLNYNAAESRLLTEVPFVPAEEPTKHNFFHTVPELDNNLVVLGYQEAFIDRVLEVSLPFPNVLYCINNESGEPPEWSRHWAKRVHQRAQERGLIAQVTDMRRKEDITHATHRTVYDAPKIYTFADVSQNTGHQIKDRQLQYRRLLEVRKYLASDPRPINHVKIYNDNFGGAPKFLRNVFAGLASTRFHRPVPWNGGTRGLGLSEEAQRILRSVRAFTGALDWFKMQPRPDLLSHDKGVYLMASLGRHYALGFDGGGTVELDARALSGPAELRWMNMRDAKWIEGEEVEPGRISLQTPGDGLWMAMIAAR
jgi:hypothetical protein